MFFKINTLFFLAFLAGCALQTEYQDLALQPYAPGIVIVSEPVGKGYYALLDNESGHWRLVGDLSTQPLTRQTDNQEVLFVNHGLRSIAPVFDKRLNTHGAHCTPSIDKASWYWLCTSQFSTVSTTETVGRNIVSCALTLCLAAGSVVELDHDKVSEAVIQSGLIELVKAKISKLAKRKYFSDFSQASKSRDIAQLEDFVTRYRGNDPDNLILEAIYRIDSIREYDAMYSVLSRILDSVK